jgi:uncharacterized RDD family membrane protein YckC
MACPLCGDVCRCAPELCLAKTDSRFQPPTKLASEAGGSASADAALNDLETNESKEQQPAAQGGRDDDELSAEQSLPDAGPDSWRQEIAARVHRYRSRRRSRGPRYPSLRLKFETDDSVNHARVRPTPGSASNASMQDLTHPSLAENMATAALPSSQSPAYLRDAEAPDARLANKSFRQTTARIIAFPRSSPVPVPLDELAEPVFDRPRILEAPEVPPPPPALGGILIEPVQEKEVEKRPGFDVPLHSASVQQRLLAAATDGVIVLAASIMFGYLFFRLTALRPLLSVSIAALAAAAGVFWAAYEYLLLVYTGSTPGLQTAKLRLSRFDGASPSRSLRRWRVLASILSAISLGMGYLWCFLDEDALCWHDRITHTYLEPL